jgi:hypothetical protein
MRSRSFRPETLLGVATVVVGWVLLWVLAVPGRAEPPKLTRVPGSSAPVQVSPLCGVVLHDKSHFATLVWNPAPPSRGYQVEVDCFDCPWLGYLANKVGPEQVIMPKALISTPDTWAVCCLHGNDKARWRVRGTQPASKLGMSDIEVGPWSPWCAFSFETTGGSSPGVGQPCGISLAQLSKSSGQPGETFEMLGTWGATQGTKVPWIAKGAEIQLQVVTWTPTKLTVRIPLTPLQPGMYKVGVWCEEPNPVLGSTYGTDMKDFEILKSAPPKK